MAVPTRISDATLQYAAKYRSKARIPALSYLHWANDASITRCAQPLPGLKQARSVQDEKVVEAIFSSHLYSQQGADTTTAVYGATTTNLIVDARPRTNAMATYARGGGTENMDHYKGCRRDYLGIENIHVMRDSINRVVDALRAADEPTTFGMEVKVELFVDDDSDVTPAADMSRSASSASGMGLAAPRNHLVPGQRPLDISALKRSNWLRHLSCLLEGTASITRNVHIASSHVMIHCSDGWDRTSQLSALAQVCLDPFFRTKKGFAVLVEKEWLSFGHRFADRCGHGGSEKYFVTAAGHGESSEEEESDDAEGNLPAGAQAAANAFWGFTKQITSNFGGGSGSNGSNAAGGVVHGPGAHVKETSPVFTQFLDCVWQIHRQYPTRFEFNEAWLSTLHRELYECRFGTFIANSERERKQAPEAGRRVIVKDTQSVWNYLLSEEHSSAFTNAKFDRSLDDPKRPDADMGVLLVKSNDVRWWLGLFGERVEEANRAIEFEESERLRRKAEKARWDEERAQERARKEAEEQRRLAEQREALAADGLGSAAPSHVRSTSSKGAVDLFTASQVLGQNGGAVAPVETDPSKLAYQARAPRAPRTVGAAAGQHIDVSTSEQHQPSDAAARFKSWAIGGWDRFQEAISAPTPSDQNQNTWSSPSHARIPTLESDNPWAEPATGSRREGTRSTVPPSVPAKETRAAPSVDSSIRGSNPWRAEQAHAARGPTDGNGGGGGGRRVDGLPNSLEHSFHRVDLNRSGAGSNATSRSQSKEAPRVQGAEQQQAAPIKTSSPPQQRASSSSTSTDSTSFDPLGVGL